MFIFTPDSESRTYALLSYALSVEFYASRRIAVCFFGKPLHESLTSCTYLQVSTSSCLP